MVEAKYEHFIPQNIAPAAAKHIVVYNSAGKRVGRAGLQALALPTTQEKLYSFGVISDTHIPDTTSDTDSAKAFAFFNKTDVDFICHCGDVTDGGTEYQFGLWRTIKSQSANPVFVVAGNHDCYYHTNNGDMAGLTDELFQQYVGHPLFYTLTRSNDVFIFLSMNVFENTDAGRTFQQKDLQALYDTLEANKDKRCILIEHLFPWTGSGNPAESYEYDLLDNAQGELLYALMEHYTKCVWFHGHSHFIYETQEQEKISNYDETLGIPSIHVSSITKPTKLVDGKRVYVDESSGVSTYCQGYVVDVYPDGLHLRGVNFVSGEYLPIATYWIDTSSRPVPEGEFKDETGQIVTQKTATCGQATCGQAICGGV